MTTPNVRPPAPSGYLASSMGALLGWVVLGGVGGTIGYWCAQLLYDPQAGMANLALLFIPAGLGGLGILAGSFLGIRGSLRRYDHPHADETARLAIPLTIVCLVLAPYAGIGVVLLPGAPATARYLTVRRHRVA